jgi:putative ABC transport system permease protein
MRRLSGRFRSSLIIGLQGIRSRKTRTLLSMISLFLGVLAVVVVQAGAEIAHQALLSNISLTEGKDGTREAYLAPDRRAIHVAMDTLRGSPNAVGVISSHAIIGEPGVNPINPGGGRFEDSGPGPFPGGPGGLGGVVVCDPSGACSMRQGGDDAGTPPPGQAIELSLTAFTGDIRQFRPYRPVSGQFLDFTSAPSLSPRLVINREAAKGFASHRIPAQMHVDGATADMTPQIIGVVDDGSDQPNAYVRADELLNWVPDTAFESGSFSGPLLVLAAPGNGELEQILRSRLIGAGLHPEEVKFNTINSAERIGTELSVTRWIFLGMAGLVLLIGVAGILNVGLATVGERVEEFALRRAVGTPRSLLAGIVLVETLLTGLLTAAAATGVAVVALQVVRGYIAERDPALHDLAFPWQAGVAGIVAGLVAGVLGGFVPALRAARIPIATIMRA